MGIVERLRNQGVKHPQQIWDWRKEAADEIESLRQQRDELLSWVDGVVEIVELFRPETPSQKEWQQRMIADAYRMIQSVVDAKCKEE